LPGRKTKVRLGDCKVSVDGSVRDDGDIYRDTISVGDGKHCDGRKHDGGGNYYGNEGHVVTKATNERSKEVGNAL
jgi:hypothetical protein